MPLDTSKLDAAIAALGVEATRTVGLEASAVLIINAQGAATATAVAAALAAQGVTDQAIIDTAVGAVTATTKQFADEADVLGPAIAANPGTPAPPPGA